MSNAWIAPKTRKMSGTFKDWPTMQARNVQRLRDAEKKGRLDFVLYGDSISSFHFGYTVSKSNPGSDAMWKKHFGSMNAVPLAIPGDQIGQVLWRVQRGNEKPVQDPRVVGFLIGVNDVFRFGEDKTRPRVVPTTDRMKQLLTWVKTNMPTSAIVLCGLTPITNPELLKSRADLNAAYKSMAASMGITYVECGSSFSNADGTPKGPGYLGDAVHLTLKGHDLELKAIRYAVDAALGSTPTPAPAASTLAPASTKIMYITIAIVCLCFVFTSFSAVMMTM